MGLFISFFTSALPNLFTGKIEKLLFSYGGIMGCCTKMPDIYYAVKHILLLDRTCSLYLIEDMHYT